MKGPFAILQDGEVIELGNGPDAVKLWREFFESSARVIDQTSIGRVSVSTIFTGMREPGSSGPFLFETMVFGSWFDRRRHLSRDIGEAKVVHFCFVELVRREAIGKRRVLIAKALAIGLAIILIPILTHSPALVGALEVFSGMLAFDLTVMGFRRSKRRGN